MPEHARTVWQQLSLKAVVDDLPDMVRKVAQPGAMVVCLGAGDITKYAGELASKL